MDNRTSEVLGLLRRARDHLQRATAESGYCMCGDAISAHNIYSGHAPVDEYLYETDQLVEKINAVLAADTNNEEN